MNIEELINAIRRRPGMFVQDKRLDYMRYFITGFYCHGAVSKTAEIIDYHFNEKFHVWVREWIKGNLGIEFVEERGWYEYIILSTKKQRRSVRLVF